MKIAILLSLALLAACEPSPEEKAKQTSREAIKYCWNEQGKKSKSPVVARFIAGTCEQMEDDFRKKHKVSP
jgi:predicted lipoprotein